MTLSSVEKKKCRCPTWYEFIQLITTIVIAVGIGIMTYIQNQAALEQNSVAIKIANDNRLEDIAIANESRINDQLIAEKNRKNDIEIAAENRLADINNALDQQRENILIDYINFLTDLLMKENLTLDENEKIRSVLRFKTIITLRQLNPERKTLVIMTLYEANLITKTDSSDAIIKLRNVDLTNIQLGLKSVDTKWETHQVFNNLDLSGNILTKSSCIYCDIIRSYFSLAIMDEIDFRHAFMSDSVLYATRLVQADFSYVVFDNVLFEAAVIVKASFVKIKSKYCVIEHTNFTETDLSEGNHYRHNMTNVVFNRSLLFQTKFHFIKLDSTKFVHSNIKQIEILNCQFINLCYIENSSLVNATIENTSFINTNISECDMSNSLIKNSSFSFVVFNNVNFNNTSLENNVFSNVSFINCDMRGAFLLGNVFHNSSLINCSVSDEQSIRNQLIN